MKLLGWFLRKCAEVLILMSSITSKLKGEYSESIWRTCDEALDTVKETKEPFERITLITYLNIWIAIVEIMAKKHHTETQS